jgi:hypothetical protein
VNTGSQLAKEAEQAYGLSLRIFCGSSLVIHLGSDTYIMNSSPTAAGHLLTGFLHSLMVAIPSQMVYTQWNFMQP